MNKKRLLMVLGGSKKPFDYYVDSVSGDDSNNGLSKLTAFKTLSALPILATYKKLGLAKGSTFREQITLSNNNITIGSYGTGARPIIDCANIIAVDEITKTIGKTNVYQATVSPDLQATETWVRVWEDSVSLVRAASIDACDATAGSYFPSSDITAPITLYFHASDSGDPTSSGKVYEFNARLSGIQGNLRENLNISGINTKRSLWGLGSIVTGKNSTVDDCLCEDGTKHNLYMQDGATITDTTCKNAYYGTNNSTLFVVYQAVAEGLGVTISTCRAEMDAYNGYVSAYYIHNSGGADTFGTVTLTNIYAENCLYGFDTFVTFDSLVVDGFTCVDVDYPIYPRKTCTFKNVVANIKNDKRLTYLIGAGTEFTLEDSVITMNTSAVASGGVIYTNTNNITVNLNNVQFVAGGVNVVWVALNGTTNTINATGCDYGIIRPYSANTLTLNSDYNRFRFSYLSFVVNGTTYANVVDYQAGTGQDANSTIG